MKCKIGSMNCLNFKNASNKDVSVFAKIIEEEQFDIIALQEIRSKRAMNEILCLLNNGIQQKEKQKWHGFHEEDSITRTRDYGGALEYGRQYEYAFIWNTNRISLPVRKRMYGSEIIYENVFYPHIYKQYRLDRSKNQIDLRYEPFYGRFQFKGVMSAPVWEIRLINTHLMFSKGKSELDLGQTLMRRNELDILINVIYDRLSDKGYKEFSADRAYTILLGDYNLNRKDSGSIGNQLLEYEMVCVSDGKGEIIKSIATEQSSKTTLKREEDNNHGFANNYDHFSYDKKRFGKTDVGVLISAVDALKYCTKRDYKEYREKVSDHLPISIELDF